MPKKIDEEYEEDEDMDDDEDEDDLEEPSVQRRGRPKKQPLKKQVKSPAPAMRAPQKRYTAFAQQAAEGIMDGETQEIIATDVWSALANIIERLERMENAIGVMQEG